jgi:ParB family chromosome partitioning protein
MNDIIYIKARNCTNSPLNVRKSSDAEKDAQLKANIAANGVLQNMIGVPVARKKGHYRIIAGSRRLNQVHANIDDGVFPEDYEIPLMPLENVKDAREISLSENFFQAGMNPADACCAFRDIIETENKQPADVAKRYGLTERFVLGRLRLANLPEVIFEALREGEITLDVAQAYASTSDVDRQASVFEKLRGTYYADNINEIRRYLASGAYKGSDPKALLVGRAAYEAAGGRIDKDLFTDAASETWIDGDILERLADDVLAAAAERIRQQDGYAEVRPIGSAHVTWSHVSELERLKSEPQPLSADEEQRKTAIEAEIEEIEAIIEQDDEDETGEAQEERLRALSGELEAIKSKPPVISDEQKAGAIAFVVLGADGQPRVYEQLFAAQQDHEVANDDDPADLDDQAGDAHEAAGTTVTGRPKYSARLLDELAMMKTELLQVHIANDPRFALDLGTFLMADAAEHRGYSYHPTELRASAPTARVHGFESGAAAAEAWAKLEEGLNRTWLDHEGLRERYDAFCALDEPARAAWLGWVIARTIHAVPFGSSGSAFLSHLGGKLAIDVAAWWRPTARNFFDRISKAMILDLFDEIGGSELRSRYTASRKFDLAASSEKLFAGDIIVDAEVKERALAWLPESMRVGDDILVGTGAEDGASALEANGDASDEAPVPANDTEVAEEAA